MEDAQAIVRHWLEDREITLAVRKLQAHLDLVSPKLRVYGPPGRPELDFEQWCEGRRRDWPYLKQMRHEGLRMKNIGLQRIAFLTREILVGVDGRTLACDKEIILEREADDAWRAVEESVKPVRSAGASEPVS